MQWVCSKCHYFGNNKNKYTDDDGLFALFFGSVFIIWYIIELIFYYDTRPSIFYLILSIILLGIGIRKRIKYITGPVCPKCEYKPMLAMDSPKGIKLIKQFDLEPTEKPTNAKQNEPNTSSSFKAPES